MSSDAAPAQLPCAPCRATGRLVSNLGGEPHEIACPWCGGTGVYTVGNDAQAAHRQAEETGD